MDFKKYLPKNLPFLGEKLPPSEFYFALNIEQSTVEGSVWGIVGNHFTIISSSRIEYQDREDLIKKSNIALDEALADFQPEPTKVLFGVPDSWLLEENLKDEYLKLLRHLVKELDISPLAYVSTTHAISHFLQKQSGVPPTTILVSVGDPLSISVIKAGKVVADKVVKKTEYLAEDIEKGLLSLTDIEVLPSKIILYSGVLDNLDEQKDKLASFSWMSRLPFLHLPKVEVLNSSYAIKAVCLAGASEINPGVTFSVKDDFKEKDLSHDNLVQKPDGLEDVGFVAGDIEEVNKEIQKEVFDDNTTATDEPTTVLKRREVVDEYPSYGGSGQRGVAGRDSFLSTAVLGIKKFLPTNVLQSSKRIGVFSLIPFLIPLFLILFLIAGYIFFPKADVTVLIDPKILEKDAQVIADPAVSKLDESSKVIPGKVVTISESGSDKAQATGKKQIGNPAKGSVNVYNLTSNKVTLGTDAVLTSSSGLKFGLDSSVSIASSSSSIGADFTTVNTPGKASSGLTASAIGPDSNVPAGTTLSVSGYPQSQVVAKVDSALTGGTSQDVTVVTSDDQKKLLASLTSDLRKKAKDDLQAQQSGDLKVLEEGLSENITKTTYSKSINDQANQFSLDLNVDYKGVAYSDTDLKTVVSKLIETNVPDGYQLNLTDSQTQADVAKLDKSGKLIFNAKFIAKLIPKLDLDKLKGQIAHQTVESATVILKRIDNVVGAEFKITPNLPGPLKRLPILPQRISMQVRPK